MIVAVLADDAEGAAGGERVQPASIAEVVVLRRENLRHHDPALAILNAPAAILAHRGSISGPGGALSSFNRQCAHLPRQFASAASGA